MSVRRITNDARARISDEAAEEHGTTSIVSGKQMWDNISADDMPRWQFRQLVAWLAVFLCMLEIVILAPFALIFRGARHQIVQMVWLVRMCGHGLPSYQALLLLVRGGPGSLGTGRLDMSDESIHLPSDKHQQERFQSSYLSNVFGFPFYLCKGDLDVYGPKRLAIALFVLKLIGLAPFQKPAVTSPSAAASLARRKQWTALVKHLFGPDQGVVHIDHIYHPDWHTARGLARFCTQGEGAIHIRKLAPREGYAGEGFVVDFQWLESESEVSALGGYKRLGGGIYLSDDLTTACRVRYGGHDYLPTDRGFAGAGLIVRTTACNYTVVGYHAVRVHEMTSNWVALASRSVLDAEHPLRRLLSPFIVLSAHVDAVCSTIIMHAEQLIGRANPAWDARSHAYLCRHSRDTFHYESLPAGLTRRGLMHGATLLTEHAEEEVALWNIFYDFVSNYVDACDCWSTDAGVEGDKGVRAFFTELSALWDKGCPTLPPAAVTSKASLIEFCTWFIYQVTAHHEQTGQFVANATLEWDYMWFSLRDAPVDNVNALVPSLQDRWTYVIGAALTQSPTPRLCSDFSRFFHEPTRHTVQKLHADLEAFHIALTKRNAKRVQPILWVDPHRLPIAVGV